MKLTKREKVALEFAKQFPVSSNYEMISRQSFQIADAFLKEAERQLNKHPYPNAIIIISLDENNKDLKDISNYIESKGYKTNKEPSCVADRVLLIIE